MGKRLILFDSISIYIQIPTKTRETLVFLETFFGSMFSYGTIKGLLFLLGDGRDQYFNHGRIKLIKKLSTKEVLLYVEKLK